MTVKAKKSGLKSNVLTRLVGRPDISPLELIVAGAAIGIGAVVLSEYEKNHPQFVEYSVDGNGKVEETTRAVFLSDLHEKEFGENNEVLLDMVREADPDVILLGGDMVTSIRGVSSVGATLRLCRELVKICRVYYGNGNHEQRFRKESPTKYASFRGVLADMGVSYLDDSTEEFCDGISITGLNLSEEHYRHFTPEELSDGYVLRHIGELDPHRYNILLAHSPEFIDAYSRTGADLVLSGHYHGGTIKLPGDVGLMTPQYQLFSTKVVGLHQKNGTNMIVSGGLGTHSINIRLNDRPQVVVVDIKK